MTKKRKTYSKVYSVLDLFFSHSNEDENIVVTVILLFEILNDRR